MLPPSAPLWAARKENCKNKNLMSRENNIMQGFKECTSFKSDLWCIQKIGLMDGVLEIFYVEV